MKSFITMPDYMGLAAAAPACGTHSQTQPAWSSHNKSSPGLAQGFQGQATTSELVCHPHSIFIGKETL